MQLVAFRVLCLILFSVICLDPATSNGKTERARPAATDSIAKLASTGKRPIAQIPGFRPGFAFSLHIAIGTTHELGEDALAFDIEGPGVGAGASTGAYVGPIGIRTILDYFGEGSPQKRLGDSRWSGLSERVSVQVLGGVRVERLFGGVLLEPLLGYGWKAEKLEITTSKSGIESVEKSKIHGKGLVIGSDQSIALGDQIRLRALFTYGEYDDIDRRLRMEIQWWSSDIWQDVRSDDDGGRIALLIGYHGAWKGQNKSETLLYIGFDSIGWL